MTTRFSKEQIEYALQMVDTGVSVGRACRQLGMSEATLYRWRKRSGVARRAYRAQHAQAGSDLPAAAPDASAS